MKSNKSTQDNAQDNAHANAHDNARYNVAPCAQGNPDAHACRARRAVAGTL